jgi:hypothetical protein
MISTLPLDKLRWNDEEAQPEMAGGFCSSVISFLLQSASLHTHAYFPASQSYGGRACSQASRYN